MLVINTPLWNSLFPHRSSKGCVSLQQHTVGKIAILKGKVTSGYNGNRHPTDLRSKSNRKVLSLGRGKVTSTTIISPLPTCLQCANLMTLRNESCKYKETEHHFCKSMKDLATNAFAGALQSYEQKKPLGGGRVRIHGDSTDSHSCSCASFVLEVKV